MNLKLFFKMKLALENVQKALEAAQRRVFAISAARIRKDAAASIVRSNGPSPPGKPPHTHRRVFLRRSLRFFADEKGAVIGPRASVVGDVGMVHEFGGQRGDQHFPERPFMGPALERHAAKFGAEWQGSVGS